MPASILLGRVFDGYPSFYLHLSPPVPGRVRDREIYLSWINASFFLFRPFIVSRLRGMRGKYLDVHQASSLTELARVLTLKSSSHAINPRISLQQRCSLDLHLFVEAVPISLFMQRHGFLIATFQVVVFVVAVIAVAVAVACPSPFPRNVLASCSSVSIRLR